MFSDKKLEITPELEQLVYKNNAVFLFGCSIVIMLTNLFWMLVDIKKHGISESVLNVRFIIIAFLVILSLTVALLLHPSHEVDYRVVHILMSIYVPAIGIETTVISIVKNMAAADAGQVYNGIALSSLYLFAFIFMPFVRIRESVLVVIPIVLTVICPALAPGHTAYNIVPNAVMGVSVILGYLSYRNIFIKMQRNALKVQDERIKYMILTRQSLETIAATIDAKNIYLKGHSKRVALYAKDIACAMGFSDEEQSKIYFCGLLHDIGKIAISSMILDKPGKLTEEEYVTIKNHTVKGSEILNNMNVYPELCECARSHHERYDGNGYPDRKKGKELSIFARIITAADAYDAMTSRRSYRNALEKDIVISEFKKGRGSQFDPDVADVVLSKLEEGDWYFDV